MSDTEELAKRLENGIPTYWQLMSNGTAPDLPATVRMCEEAATHLRALAAEVEALRKQLAEAEREINIKADWIDKTINDMAAKDQRLDEARSVLLRISEVGDEPADGSIDSLYEYSKGLVDEILASIDAKPEFDIEAWRCSAERRAGRGITSAAPSILDEIIDAKLEASHE